MKIAFVIPWFHAGVSGGAEAQCRDAAGLLAGKGHEVTILATCIRDHASDWNINHFPPGEAVEGGLRVLRFAADRTDRRRFDRTNARYMAMNEGSKHRLGEDEENAFFASMAPSAALLDHLGRRGDEQDFYIFMPYLFATSIFGPPLCGERSVLLPCLHDEGYAYSRPVARAFAAASAVIFNTRSEREMARRILPSLPRRQAVVGDSVSLEQSRGDAEGFRRRHDLREPFILCLGRRDRTKRTDLLVSYFREYKKRRPSPLRLVLAGPGSVDSRGCPDIVDLGYLSREDKYGALAACSFLCNPSLNESFSIVLLEAWANGRPVLAASQCAPTKELCRRSGGGLWFGDFGDFVVAVDLLTSRREEAGALGAAGRLFTERNYAADAVAVRYDRLLRGWKGGDEAAGDEETPDGEPEGAAPAATLMEGLRAGKEPLPEPRRGPDGPGARAADFLRRVFRSRKGD